MQMYLQTQENACEEYPLQVYLQTQKNACDVSPSQVYLSVNHLKTFDGCGVVDLSMLTLTV